MKSIAIMGLGLMGGSLGLALRKSGFPGRVTGYARNPRTRSEALRLGMADAVFEDPGQAVAEADLVVFCVPILSIPELLEKVRGRLKPGALLTDVGSTKGELVRRMEALLRELPVTFVGSHPIAGSEQQGLQAAHADLYRDATVLVTAESSSAAADRVIEFWRGLGARVCRMSPAEHDRIMARTSHLPHVAAAILAATVGRDGDLADLGRFCGPGFRDTTRIAEGSPKVWMDILQTNQDFLAQELEAFKIQLDELLHSLRAGDMNRVRNFLETGRERRQRLGAPKPPEGTGR